MSDAQNQPFQDMNVSNKPYLSHSLEPINEVRVSRGQEETDRTTERNEEENIYIHEQMKEVETPHLPLQAPNLCMAMDHPVDQQHLKQAYNQVNQTLDLLLINKDKLIEKTSRTESQVEEETKERSLTGDMLTD